MSELNAVTKLSALRIPPAGQILHWQGGQGSSNSFALSCLAQTHQVPFVVVTGTQEETFQVANELSFFSPALEVDVFPDLETLPYDTFSPQSDVISDRLKLLSRLLLKSVRIVVLPMRALQSRLPPMSYVGSRSLSLRNGSPFNPITSVRDLLNVGYRNVDTVMEAGDLAVRGAIVDIFPIGSVTPIRLDLFDNEIESIRLFDPDTQRTTGHARSFTIVPAKEYPLDDESIERFRSRWHESFSIDVRECPTYLQISEGIPAEGVECYLPLFFENTATLFDYLPDDSILVLGPNALGAAQELWGEVKKRFENLREEPGRPLLAPSSLYLRPEETRSRVKRYARIGFDPDSEQDKHLVALGALELPSVEARMRSLDPIENLRTFLGNVNRRVLIVAETMGRLDHLEEFLRRGGIHSQRVDGFLGHLNAKGDVTITVAPIDRATWVDDIVVLSESQIFGPVGGSGRRRSDLKATNPELAIRNLTELQIGAPVVHTEHGVGRYRGLELLTVDDCPGEFLLIEYAGGDKLYIPVSSLHLISRYTGTAEEHAPLDKLGSDRWEKAKKRAARKIRDVAAELLDIYARRKASVAFKFPPVDDEFHKFCDECEFDLTPDQEAAVDRVITDLSSEKAMDRLVCGDVGFGKTEVAMRAAFHVAQSGKQIVMLVPTTLLAQQHFASFQNRYSGWPHVIEVVSRFRSRFETEGLLKRVQEGKIDILIGTHRLLHAGFTFKDLGLLIVDEEHRFGVAHKEKLKAIQASVDVLTLTATPIPRTLNMAIGGLRDLSIIATPPARRLAIRTFVARSSKQLLSDALNRELARGGQAFFVHNEVHSIERRGRQVAELAPNARVGIGHGQMPKRALEGVMSDFYHRRCNVLVCSTIIESGIDVPNANTIIVDRADRFGLAQLHQLRGRVGRSHRQAYAYLLKPGEESMTPDAVKRLEAIQRAGDLGIGFTLALHDLEIRGAGELLGKDQSGQIEAIGFTLYMEMLERTINAMKLGTRIDVDVPLHAPGAVEVELHLAALIPNDYLPDVHLRLVMYKRIAMAKNQEELAELRVEMIDRFGMLPDAARNLFRVARLRFTARHLGVAKINIGRSGGYVEFSDETPLDPTAFIRFISRQPAQLRMTGASRLRISKSLESGESRFQAVEGLLAELQGLAVDEQAAA